MIQLDLHKHKSNKELKNAYRQMRFPAGLYQIRNLENGRIYIGANRNLNAIWNRHNTELSFGSHQNAKLQQEWTEFGESNFTFEILDQLDTDELTSAQIASELTLLKMMYLEHVDKGILYNTLR